MQQNAKRPSLTNRVVIRTSVVHVPDGGEMQHWGEPRSFVLESVDPAHVAWLTLEDLWQRLDYGHVEEPSLLLVENHLKSNAGVVELSSDGGEPFSRLIKGKDASIPGPGTILARCVGGRSKIKVVAIPK